MLKSLIDDCPIWYKLALVFAALLILLGIFLPPVGIIDRSILIAIGEFGGMALLGLAPVMLKIWKNKA